MTTPPANRAAFVLSALALTISVAGVGGPVVAAAFDARNADKVDGRHAVVAKAKPAQRKGKVLAAHPRTGRLPNNIIERAPDAAKLGGQPPATYLDRYTKAEVDAMPASYVMGYGTVTAEGVLRPASYAPGVRITKSDGIGSDGYYGVVLRGYDPGCTKSRLPMLMATAVYGHVAISQPSGTACGSGDVVMTVVTRDATGAAKDSAFTFALFAPGPLQQLVPARR